MKEIFCKAIACCAAVLFLAACDKADDNSGIEAGGNRILLDISSVSTDVSRAAASDLERKVERLDLLIFDEAGSKKWYERIEVGATGGGTIALTAKKSSFDANAKYWVYLIANGSDEESAAFAEPDFDRAQLRARKREDRYLHLTGLSRPDIIGYDIPQTFLMDGAAYPEGETEPLNAEPVVLNNGNVSDDTKLKVTLRRAAVKLVLRIYKGDKITFNQAGASYYLRNMPYTTSLVAGVNSEADVRTTSQARTNHFVWTDNLITVTAYVYAHSWDNDSAMEREPRWIVDIPMTYDPDPNDDTPAEVYPDCYYQIPVCRGTALKRNTCYEVSLTLNVPGGTNPSQPVNLNEISFNVLQDWIDKDIPIGGEGEHPMFLTLNRTEMEMHNIDTDRTTLRFASSSNVTATVKEAYYYDKFGQKQSVSNNILNKIKITPDTGLNGGVKIYSPVPTNKTIRYIVIEFTNKDGVTPRTVTVAQYPLEYITNIQSWYSYRDDFKNTDPLPTTYEYAGDRIYGISLATRNISSWNGSYTYEASYAGWWGEQNTSSGFFRSKVVTNVTNGKSTFMNYYWDSNNRLSTSRSNEYNGRLYTIRLTASSDTYTIGRPRLIEDKDNPGLMVTAPGADNAQLVSPSFMIASSLSGFMANSGNLTMDDSANSLRVAREHCAHYVEVYKDENGKKVILDDWRLPTKAELDIVLNFQGREGQEADAIDFLLNGSYYYCAGGRVYNENYNVDAGEVRCVRDAYDDKADNRAADKETQQQ